MEIKQNDKHQLKFKNNVIKSLFIFILECIFIYLSLF
jgi:hypothetical protein